jgi:hypothetical protein
MWAMELSSNVPLNWTDGSNILAPKIIIPQQVYYMKRIKLTEEEVEHLNEFTKKSQKSARALTRAQVLLLVHKGEKETTIAEILNISRASVSNIKKRYRKEGPQSALKEKPRPGRPKKIHGTARSGNHSAGMH